MKDLSVVVAAKNEVGNIAPLVEQVSHVLKSLKKSFEIIIIDDGSDDGTFDEIKRIAKKNKNLRGIKFSNWFKKAAALSAGFDASKGKLILTMDADLQDNPADIPAFFDKLDEGYDVVVGWKRKRQDPITKVLGSRIYNATLRMMTGIKLHDIDCGYRLMKREVVQDINIYAGMYRYIPLLAWNDGFKVSEIEVHHQKRLTGKSKYGAGRIFNGVLDLLTIKFLTKYTKRPLHFFGMWGVLSSGMGVLAGIYLTYIKFTQNVSIGSRPLLWLAILLIIVGVQFITLGLLAEMIANFTQKSEKKYSVKEKVN